MSFRYVLLPADESKEIVELTGSKSGGLENDSLRKEAERRFSAGFIDRSAQRAALVSQLQEKGIDARKVDELLEQSCGDGGMTGAVEIITLAIPSAQSGFRTVSMYCDGNISFKQQGRVPNTRATQLARACGHKDLVVMGDCFIGRALDDESREWERMDFSPAEVSVEASWVKDTAASNAGKNMKSFSTSGALSALHQQRDAQQKPQAAAAPVTASEFAESTQYVWSQGEDEVEVRMRLPAGVLTKHLAVQISADRLYVGRKGAGGQGAHLEGTDLRLCAEDGTGKGAKLGGPVNAGESTWSVADEREGRVLSVTLAKAGARTWKGLFL
jgi:hypothetical protein